MFHWLPCRNAYSGLEKVFWFTESITICRPVRAKSFSRRQNIQSETELRIWNFCLRLFFLNFIHFHTVLLTTTEKRSLAFWFIISNVLWNSIEGKKFNRGQKIRSETELRIWNELYVFNWLRYKIAYSGREKRFLVPCKHYDIELDRRQKSRTEVFWKDVAGMFCLRSISVW